jgi:hypothetical protein
MRLRYLIPAAIAAFATYTALVRERDRAPGTDDLTGWDSLEPYRSSVPTAGVPAPASAPGAPVASAPPPVIEAPPIAERPTGYSADDEFLGLFPPTTTSGPSVYDYLAGDLPAEAEAQQEPEPPALDEASAAPPPDLPAVVADEPGAPPADEPTPGRPDPIDWPVAPAAAETAPSGDEPVAPEPTISRPDPIDWPVATVSGEAPPTEAPTFEPPEPDSTEAVEVPAPGAPVEAAPVSVPADEPAGIRVRPPDMTAPSAVDEGRFALGGWAAASGHSVVSAVTFRRRLPQAVTAQQIELTIDASENVPEAGLIVLADPGFAPDREGFTLLLTAAEAGSFSAAGSYRVRL